MTPWETNDELRAQVERELPTPAGGFETDEQADAHKQAHERRFMELVNTRWHKDTFPNH